MTPKLKAALDAKERTVYVKDGDSITLLVHYASEELIEKYNQKYNKYPFYSVSFSLSDL